MILLLFFVVVSFACHPQCRYLCDDPVCEADCKVFCREPNCIYQCVGFPPTENPCPGQTPKCETFCNVTQDTCESDSCPMCTTICEEPTCQRDGYFCGIVCPPPDCAWKCFLPTNCREPICQLQCDQPACELPPNSTYKLYVAAGTAQTANLLLLFFLTLIFIQTQ